MGDVSRVELIDRVKWGRGRAPPHSASWDKNTIMTECTQESDHRQPQSMYSLVCGRSHLQVECSAEPEPVFVNLLRSTGIDSQLGGPVRKPYLSHLPAKLHRLWNRILGIDFWVPSTFTNTGSVLLYTMYSVQIFLT